MNMAEASPRSNGEDALVLLGLGPSYSGGQNKTASDRDKDERLVSVVPLRCDSLDLTAECVDNGNKCSNRLAKLCNNSKFSDIALVVGDEKYYAHKLILANASDVFEQMLTSHHWKDSDKAEIHLQESDDCIPVFGDFLRYVYCGQITLSTQSVLGLLVLADKYNIPDLKDCCSTYMSCHLVSPPDTNKSITWYQYAVACNSYELQHACFNYIRLNMDTVIMSPDWVYIDKENLILLLQMSDVIVESEYVLLLAVVRWICEDSRSDDIKANLQSILPYIRFPMILPEHLAEFEETEFERDHHELFSCYLLSAYRYHALSIRGKKDPMPDVPRSQFMYRNYTDETYSIHVDVVRKGFRSCPRVSSKVEKPLSLPLNICNTTQAEQCKLKVTFYPQGYYTTSLWNSQLNLAKLTDQTKLVVSHRGGVEVREAEVCVVIYAQSKGVRYADYAISESHTFETYGTFEIENAIDLERLKGEDSAHIIDGTLYLKVFIRPVSFHREAHL